MSEEKFRQFMNGFVAAAQLLRRAAETGFFIEYICLGASIIDAALRIGLILQHQLRTSSTEILEDLLLQSPEDRIISEREIYRRARQENVIDEDLFQKLETLYSKRNRVVHRYVISELATIQVLEIASEFEQTLSVISTAVGVLEARQAESGVGITKTGKLPGLGRALAEMSAEKHGDNRLARLLESGGA